MLSLTGGVRVYACSEAVDMRKGFDGLAILVREVLRRDPLSGHLFVFFGRRWDRAKVLWWTPTGYVLVHKRLERGRFVLPRLVEAGATRVEIEAAELVALLEGIDLRRAKRVPRWHPPEERGRV